ncbi:MAG: hypothetical protein RML15_08385 [Bacteroidota bacterium]|nr:hypothetical protein [Candidatus Kapabacteria bacterium]MCS7302707.1 hypothetical protein [Candidatus Kapabacteria bacterium]MCX7937076.1 hypothetical protein [Chlorobiota bacterium]MDW8075175.1 hypothetical protein [Bacteroidota bacterium]MDW8272406.1 hypothetical protein [Bacteroidota bacterium]
MSKFKNYRYGNISIFQLDAETMKGVTQLLNPEPVITESAKACSPARQTQIDDKVAELGCAADLSALQDDEEIKRVLRGECIDYAKYAIARKQWECNTFKRAYVVTTRYIAGRDFKVIALLTSNSESRVLANVLASPRDIYTYTQLRQSAAPAGSPAKTLYEYLYNFVIQQSEAEGINVTAEAQGLGDEQFIPKLYGVSLQVREDDVTAYVRTTDGQAMDYMRSRELMVSPDLISYRDYTPSDPSAATEGFVYNRTLPKYGVELRYGLETINYPSFFSDRVTLNALWGSNRLGVILPTSGWASVARTFGVQRTMTYAGWGINGVFDFPLKITNANTGVFNVAASYVFGEARQSDHQRQLETVTTITRQLRGTDTLVNNQSYSRALDYLIRFAAQVHYSFAIAIDSGNFFRFRIGGALYSREIWEENNGSGRYQEIDQRGIIRRDSAFVINRWFRTDTRFIGGVSARIDFMAQRVTTPYGFGLQYFDDAIYAQAWLLIPISQQIGLRVDGQYFAPILRDPHEWEVASVFIPTLRVIYNF